MTTTPEQFVASGGKIYYDGEEDSFVFIAGATLHGWVQGFGGAPVVRERIRRLTTPGQAPDAWFPPGKPLTLDDPSEQ